MLERIVQDLKEAGQLELAKDFAMFCGIDYENINA